MLKIYGRRTNEAKALMKELTEENYKEQLIDRINKNAEKLTEEVKARDTHEEMIKWFIKVIEQDKQQVTRMVAEETGDMYSACWVVLDGEKDLIKLLNDDYGWYIEEHLSRK